MELEEFIFLYADMKSQLKQMPSLAILLKHTEKSVKKLECINLYSATQKRQFDFERYEEQIFDQITQLLREINTFQSQKSEINSMEMQKFEKKLQQIKNEKICTFDTLYKKQQELQRDIEQLISDEEFQDKKYQGEIKEVDQYEDQNYQDDFEKDQEHQILLHLDEPQVKYGQKRIEKIKIEIQNCNLKITKLNKGRGKWFQGDHNDFIKIYNRAGGDAKKIIEEGIKFLGMKNTEILDHLEVYQGYLQLEKEKKIANEEFRNIKFLQKEEEEEKNRQKQLIEENKVKIKKTLKQGEDRAKKIQIQEFKRKKIEQKNNLISLEEKKKEVKKKTEKIDVEKKKQIIQRNKKFIEQKQEIFKATNARSNSQNIRQVKPSKGSNIILPNEILALKKMIPKIPTGTDKKIDLQNKEINPLKKNNAEVKSKELIKSNDV